MKEIFFSELSLCLILVPVLINVAFLTLIERKILGLSQIRRGPNKVSFLGVPQPFSDAIKLFRKESTQPFLRNFFLYYLSPIIRLFLTLWIWSLWAIQSAPYWLSLNVLLLLIILRLNIYPLIFTGWASNSKYPLIGSLRGVVQTISYEISLALIVFAQFSLILELRFASSIYINNKTIIIALFPPLFLLWLFICIAETNRTPFDFAEGESELVSGFNTEYRSGGFAVIFIAEYSSILFLRLLRVILYLTFSTQIFLTYILITILAFFWVWSRATYPRFRYDKLISLAWKTLLPWTLRLIFLSLSLALS